MTLSIRFRNSPAQYSAPGTPLRTLVELATGEQTRVVGNPFEAVDIEFSSVHYNLFQRGSTDAKRLWDRVTRRPKTTGRLQAENPGPGQLGEASLRIWFTGENVRPPFGDWDLYLSFDLDSLGGRNQYFPLWWESVGCLGAPTFGFTSSPMNIEALLSSRAPLAAGRRKFVCAFIGNPTPMRLHTIRALESLGQVDIFGRAAGRPVADKSEVAKEYRYMLAFENDIYPGYVTEKVFEAWSCGTVPLWWGLDPSKYVNPNALINLADLESVDHLVDEVSKLEKNREAFEQVNASPILLRGPDLQTLVNAMAQACSSLRRG